MESVLLKHLGWIKCISGNILSGCKMDGQYIHLNFSDHLQNVLLKDYHVTWDPAHMIELSIKDSTSDKGQSFIEKSSDTAQSIMKLLSYRKPYTELLNNDLISIHFSTPEFNGVCWPLFLGIEKF